MCVFVAMRLHYVLFYVRALRGCPPRGHGIYVVNHLGRVHYVTICLLDNLLWAYCYIEIDVTAVAEQGFDGGLPRRLPAYIYAL